VSTETFAVAVVPDAATPSGDLVLAVERSGALCEVIGEQPGHDVVHCFPDWDELVGRITRSGRVMIEEDGGSAPILLGPRPRDCSDDLWLTEVAGCLMPVLPDVPSRCRLVSAALSRVAGGPVVIARRPGAPSGRDWSGRWAGSRRLQVDGRWVREFPVDVAGMAGRRADSRQPEAWSLVMADDVPASQARCLARHPLMAGLASFLAGHRPGCLRQAIPHPVLGMVQSVAAADAAAFAAAAAELTDASVAVVGGDGSVIASSPGSRAPQPDQAWRSAGQAREILLRDQAGLYGAIRISPDPLGAAPESSADLGRLLGDAGLALIRSITSARRERDLANRLVMLSCLAGRGAGETSWRDRTAITQTARRLVLVRTGGAIDGNGGERLLDTAIRAADEHSVMSGLCLAISHGSLIGLYPDGDTQLGVHRIAWAQVLRALAAYGPLTVVVGSAVTDFADFPGQHRMLGEIASIQQSGSRYLDLPPVVMLDDVGPLAEIIAATPGCGFAPFVERVLGELLDDTRFGGQLLETLYAYLQSGGSPREAGAMLHLHPSTVKYRIRVIRELLGPRLADRSSRLDIELAVRLCLAAQAPAAMRARTGQTAQPAFARTKSATTAPRR
jgi:hypothetical protein